MKSIDIDCPKGLSELPPEYWKYFDFLWDVHLNSPRGCGDSTSKVIARNISLRWPKGLAWGDMVLWMRSRYLPKPFDRQCIKVMTRHEYENQLRQ